MEHLQRKRDQQVLVMLLTQVLFYIVLTIPLLAFYFYNAVTIKITNKLVDRLAIERFANFLVEAIIILFPVSSFYLYTLVSHTFFNELVRLFRSVLALRCSNNSHGIELITKDITYRSVPGHQPRLILKSESFNHDRLMLVHPLVTCQQQGNIGQDTVE